jgi:hypothetical protein
MSLTVIALIVAAVVILLLAIGGGIIFFVVRKGKAKEAAQSAQHEAFPTGFSAPVEAAGSSWAPPPAVEPAPPEWGAGPDVPVPSEPPVAAVPPAPTVPEPPAWTPPPPPPAPAPVPEQVSDPFPPVQAGIPSSPSPVAHDPLAATLGPESYTTTPSVSAIPVSTVDPFATTPSVSVRPVGEVVPAILRAHDGSVIQLVRVQMRVGRHPECEIVIPTPGTSRNHAEFQCVNGAWIINDLNSGNGTFVNGVRVRTHQLASGDEVRVDQTKFWFTLGA